jgi:hypothetical protein
MEARRARSRRTLLAPRKIYMPLMLVRDAEHEVLAAHIKSKHPLLASLLPEDIKPADLFRRVEQKKDLATYFLLDEASDKAAATRALARLEDEIQVLLNEEAEFLKLQTRKEKRKLKKQQREARMAKRKKQEVEPPLPPTMTLDEAAAAKVLAAVDKEKERRKALLEKGLVLRCGVGPKETAGEHMAHVEYFWKNQETACEAMGVELRSASRAFGVVIFLDGPALEKIEAIKRAGNPKAKGKDRLRNANWSLPVDGRPVLEPCTCHKREHPCPARAAAHCPAPHRRCRV